MPVNLTVEALLFTSGAKNRLGNIVDGTPPWITMRRDQGQMTILAGLAHVD